LPVRHYDWIAHFGRRTPDKVAVIDLGSGRRFTYAQFDARIARLATHLRDRLAIKRGDRVAVLALNTTDTLEVQFACGRLGAVLLPLNTRLTVPELHYIVGDASPSLMIHDTELAQTALAVAGLCKVGATLSLGPDGSYEAAIAASHPLEPSEIVTLDDISTIMYTSGTTGRPKGAIITHGIFYYIVDRWKDMYISGGENVYPAEVENVLHQLPAIAEAAVIGIPNAQWGECGMAIIAVRPGHPITEAEIHAHCAANLARFKCPARIEFVQALPRNATGKIHKPTLRQQFGSPGAVDTTNLMRTA
jgi:acyl-CoA synthetase (AMP-forming)/AMP-acid ligase II